MQGMKAANLNSLGFRDINPERVFTKIRGTILGFGDIGQCKREIPNPIMETERGQKMNNVTETGIM